MNLTNKNIDDVYLAQWLNGEISDEKLRSYLSDEDLKAYKKIKKRLELFETPEFKSERLKKNIEKTIYKKDSKIRIIFKPWIYAAAMLAVIFLTYLYFSPETVSYRTSYGQKENIYLPDGSEVNINAKSEISYDEKKWNVGERQLRLKGEAFFKVKKGNTFTVRTTNGSVTVMGTRFDINSRDNFFNVKCYSGKVQVIYRLDTVYLTRGKEYQYNGHKSQHRNFKEVTPGWLNNESVFKSTPLRIVISSLENQYGIVVKSGQIDENQIYTGSFVHDDLNSALKSVFLPMDIKYKIENKVVFLSKR